MKTVLVSGNFNVLHPGHLRLLRFAHEVGDRLVVAVRSDRLAGRDSFVPEGLRLEGVRSNGWVDEAFILDEPIEDLIARLKPDIVVKGKEHESRFNVESEALSKCGGDLIFSSGEAIFSSLDLIQRHIRDLDNSPIEFPEAFSARHNISRGRLRDILDQIVGLRVLVIGDLIVDEYITCEALGMSQEDPSIVVTPINTQRFLGGAGIVASHASGVGALVKFFSVAGNDESHEFASRQLRDHNVEAHIFEDSARPTTLKQRFRADQKTLLRISHLHQDSISSELQEVIKREVLEAVGGSDVLIFSDFNYGCLPQHLVAALSLEARRHNVIMAADSQSSSQVGDVARFRGMHLLTPTEREARLSLRNQEDGLAIIAEELARKTDSKALFLKLGSEGMILHASEGSGERRTDRIPALNALPRDVAGAGDSLLVLGILATAVGATPWEAACLGSLAAAIQVGRVGNIPLSGEALLKELAP